MRPRCAASSRLGGGGRAFRRPRTTRVAPACPVCYIMLDDGVKGAGVDEDQVRVADISMHLLEAIERGESAFHHPGAPLVTD